MSSCKDCVHYEVCVYPHHITISPCDCNHFKPKSRFVELPCEVGQNLWFLQNDRLAFGVVENILKNHSGLFAYVFELDDGDVIDEWSIPLCDIGKTVFIGDNAHEEAEKALKERWKE